VIEALLQAERLLVHGMVDQAERIYQGAIDQDPNNSIAVVGLARVALERGDDELAYEQAKRALEIDPQNAAALRLEARLGEVLDRRHAAAQQPAPDAAEDAPAGPDVANADVRPSEQFVFNRNPSMADHVAAEERRAQSHDKPEDHAQ
jgi:tetratricopeptide (TPR) repeat protein